MRWQQREQRQRLGSPAARRALAALHDRPVSFRADTPPDADEDGWQVDHYRQPLGSELSGPPLPDGVWEVARRLVEQYEFADPRMVRAVYYPDVPLEDRDMLLEARFAGLRFLLGVRVGGVVDEQRLVGGRPVRVWGWDYKTLQGHLEAGQMDYEVWKWLDTGEVEFHIRRFVRTARITNPVVRAGWAVFGRWMQVRFVRRACQRMTEQVISGLSSRPALDPDRSSASIVATPGEVHAGRHQQARRRR